MSIQQFKGERDHLRKLAPIFLIAGISLFAAPMFHPNNTCNDWLVKWGQLSALRSWIPIHQVATLGFALGVGALLLVAIIGPRDIAGLSGGAASAIGFLMMSLMTLVHATAVSVVGTAYNAATSDAERNSLRIIANAFVSYDVAVEGVAAVLISGGLVLLALYLRRISMISTILAVVLAGDGAIWGVQYYRLLRFIHFGFPEWVPYTSLGLWMCAASIILTVTPKERVTADAPLPSAA
jgi:hypothetical protein